MARKKRAAPAQSGADRLVLIVDDDESTQEYLSFALERAGFPVSLHIDFEPHVTEAEAEAAEEAAFESAEAAAARAAGALTHPTEEPAAPVVPPPPNPTSEPVTVSEFGETVSSGGAPPQQDQGTEEVVVTPDDVGQVSAEDLGQTAGEAPESEEPAF